MSDNQDLFLAEQYFLADPNARLENGATYEGDRHIIDDPVGRTLNNDELRNYLEASLKRHGYDVKFTKYVDRVWNGHKNDTYVDFSVESNIKSQWAVDGDNIEYDYVGKFVQRRRKSEFWKNYDPHEIFKILDYDRDNNLLYLSNYKDARGNYIANLAEYMHCFPNQITKIRPDSLMVIPDITEPTRKKELIICSDDGGFKLYN
jgi:hypothetical protein